MHYAFRLFGLLCVLAMLFTCVPIFQFDFKLRAIYITHRIQNNTANELNIVTTNDTLNLSLAPGSNTEYNIYDTAGAGNVPI
jgi:hypothetical protein